MFIVLVSFGCMFKSKTENMSLVSFQDIVYFFYCSWVSAYKLLGQNLQKEKNELNSYGIDIPNTNQLITWAKKCHDSIRMYLENSLRECGINFQNDISYEQFKMWISRNPQHIQVFFANKFITIATNLSCLEDIEYVEINQQSNY